MAVSNHARRILKRHRQPSPAVTQTLHRQHKKWSLVVNRQGMQNLSQTNTKTSSRTGNPTCIAVVCLAFALTGCDRGESGPTARQMLRQQQLRSSQQASSSQTTQQRLDTALAFLEDENFIAAGEELSRILIADPNNQNALILSAKLEAAQGNVPAAVKILESLEHTDPLRNIEMLWLAADWSIDSGDYSTAEQKLKDLLNVDRDQVKAHRQLAIILNNQGCRIKAAPHLLALAKLGQSREKELFAMITYGNPFIDTTIPKPARSAGITPAMLAQAKVSRSDGDMGEAVAMTEQLRTAFPESTAIAAFLGRLHTELQNEEALQAWFENLPADIEDEPEYWYSTGTWMQRHDRHQEAVRCLGEAILRDPTDRYAYQAFERSLRFSGKKDKAELAAARVQKLTETSQLARQFGLKRGSKQEMNRMAELLLELGRPWESIAWRETASKYYTTLESEKKLIAQTRQALQQHDTAAGPNVLTCNIELESWPLPTIAEIATVIESETNKPTISTGVEVPIELANVADKVDLNFTYDNGDQNRKDDAVFIYQLTGGGIGIIDYNLDGWMDLYFTQGGGNAFDTVGSKPNQLFANLHGERFQSVSSHSQTADTGYGQGVAVADINQDGFPDLVVANIGPNLIYVNNGDGTFTRRPIPLGSQAGGWTTSIACGDLGGDHLPEIVAVNYIEDPQALTIACTPDSTHCSPRVFQPAADSIWQVDPNGDLSSFAGCLDIVNQPSFGFAAVLTDFDDQPGNELYIANDTRPNHFWTGYRSSSTSVRQLRENAKLFGCGSDPIGRPRGCMGIAYGDLDHNGKIDLHVTNYWNEPSDTYLQRATGLFVPAGLGFGTFAASQKTVGWGTQAVDFDHNGWLDLAVLNGHVVNKRGSREPYEMKPQLFQALSDGSSTRVSMDPGDRYWTQNRLGRTMAVLDWNRDARPDLVTNHLDGPVALLSNNTKAGNSVQVELQGVDSERDATGAKVTVTSGQQTWTRWQAGGDGFLCSNEPVLDFGIANANSIDRVDVQWPSGQEQTFHGLKVNQRYLIIEGKTEAYAREH
ncbi:MAG: RNA-binding protein [Rhodopirellula sp.]|nr:RNA-binding protein [Rhodopirellula sp.]